MCALRQKASYAIGWLRGRGESVGKTKINVSKKKTLQHIKELIKIWEGYHLEFKRFLDKSFAEEVCAFANSSGGKILLGIADDGKLKGNYYIITAETCTRIGDTTMENSAGNDVHFKMLMLIMTVRFLIWTEPYLPKTLALTAKSE